MYDAGDDPRALVEVSWTEIAEAELLATEGADNGDPRNVDPSALGRLEGIEVAGTLRGIGWNSAFEPPTLTAEGCDDADRSPGVQGDWSGDVDFVVIEVGEVEDAVLCAAVVFDAPDLGWDLMLYPLDSCGLPRTPVQDPAFERALGLQREGASGGWRASVQTGERYGLLLAGYDAPEPVAEYDYHVGAAIVVGAGGRELCPMLPSEQGGAE